MATALAENKVGNINFERRDLISARKSHPSPNDFEETFAFNLIQQNVTHFSIIFFSQNLCAVPLKKLNLNYYSQAL